MEVPCDSAARRVRPRDLGERRLALDGRRFVVGADVGGSGARPRLHPHQRRDHRLLRRLPPRRQPVQHERHRARREIGQARVAPAAGQARHLELRHADGADSARRERRRPAHSRVVPDHQAVVGLFVQPAHRRADLADGNAPGAAIEGPGRKAVGDAALRDQAGAVRPAGPAGKRPDRLHARE